MTPKAAKICKGATIVAILTIGLRFALPCPLSGYWRGPNLTENHGCDEHAFLEFSDGRVWLYHGEDARNDWGTYRKAGWNRYEWLVPLSGTNSGSVIVVPGWFFARWYDSGTTSWGYRDYQLFDALRISRLTAVKSPTKRSGELPSAGAAGSRSL